MIGYDLASNKRSSSDALGNLQDDASKRARHQVTSPSRVIHCRNLPSDCTENDLLMIASPFGRVMNVLMLKGKNQAFIQMQDVLTASSLVEFYSINPCMIRTNTVYLQYSNREEITAPSQSSSLSSNKPETPNSILLATVSNLVYPTTVDILHQIFSKYGNVLKIVTFTKNNNFQSLIQFQDLPSAIAAKASLDGQNIYVGCCTLRIQFSTLTNLEVKYNNDRSRDFTNPHLPTGGSTTPAQTTTPGMATGYQQLDYSDPNTANYFAQMGYPAVSYEGVPGMQTASVGMPGMSTGNSVLIVSGLNIERVTPDTLFTLFGVYGDVQRVKILFNKKDTALVQMNTPQQAETVMQYLNGTTLYGSPLRINISKHQSITMVNKPNSEEESAKYTKDYSTSNAHRYKLAGSKNYQHICPPSATLHISNIPPTSTEQTIRAVFGQFGTVVGFKYFVNEKKMALIQMSSVSEALEALVGLHDSKIDETQPSSIKVSFAKSTIV